MIGSNYNYLEWKKNLKIDETVFFKICHFFYSFESKIVSLIRLSSFALQSVIEHNYGSFLKVEHFDFLVI